ncbi:MAG TPA: tRNA pseudouridine(55) synthase TruB [Allosphingosinicella sp.]|nr:tRNA pseudouridine(55) synthase TruB [Allosphingosinicella sp.]
MHGWLVLDKPVGPGSTQIVAAVKRALRDGGYSKVKVGHGGTLDPLASGVLPIALGEATKLSGRMLDADKAYEFTIGFGSETDTLDLEGAVVETSDKRPTRAAIEAILPRFTGEIEQVPPAYSALKVDGKRAYDLARAGEKVALKSRKVVIHALTVRPEAVEAPSFSSSSRDKKGPSTGSGRTVGEATLAARVSKGTYIRALARDIARALGTVGHVTMLRRTRAGPFALDRAISLDKLGAAAKGRTLEQHLLPLAAGLDDIPALPVTPDQAGALRLGRKLTGIAEQPGLHLATDQDVPVALVEFSEGELRVVRGFNL